MQTAFSICMVVLLCLLQLIGQIVVQAGPVQFSIIEQQISQHPGKSGVLILDKGEQALLARAWLADRARHSIEVQYFIWSTDNIGILASEALLRAADRGVKVRVIVDDLLIDAPDKTLLALAVHPNIDIRIYNPKHSVGTSTLKRIFNIFSDFRGVNQRMHDKTFIVDGRVAITGGRNMADEYFDYDHEYNFRDRDAVVFGQVVSEIRQSFDRFWQSQLSVPVQERFLDSEVLHGIVDEKHDEVRKIYAELHSYAASPDNFAPEVREAINNITAAMDKLAANIRWAKARFISDRPGKNENHISLGGGGLTTAALAELFNTARQSIVIQSPYLVLSDEAELMFADAIRRGVRIMISTNSLASTDNLQAFSGYKNQRQALLDMGLQIFEYRPYPQVQRQLLERYAAIKERQPVFAIHAKSMVIDSSVVYIGTYNLDPRSENLNTEVGVIIDNEQLAREVEQAIALDTMPQNSWSAKENPDQHASLWKRIKVWFWQLMPIKPLL